MTHFNVPKMNIKSLYKSESIIIISLSYFSNSQSDIWTNPGPNVFNRMPSVFLEYLPTIGRYNERRDTQRSTPAA